MTGRYKSVNGSWPTGEMPTLTEAEAITAAKRLYRFAMKKRFAGKVRITSGNRHTWIARGELRVNPSAGWWHMVHDLSHLCAFKLYPGSKPHSLRHASLERSMIEYVVDAKWLEGKLKRPERIAAPVDRRSIRAALIAARMESWERKRKRAEAALKKLKRQRAYYARVLSPAA